MSFSYILPCTLLENGQRNTSHGQKEQKCFFLPRLPDHIQLFTRSGSSLWIKELDICHIGSTVYDGMAWNFSLKHMQVLKSSWLIWLIHMFWRELGCPVQVSTNYQIMTIWCFNMFHMSSFTTSDLSFSTVGYRSISKLLCQIDSKTLWSSQNPLQDNELALTTSPASDLEIPAHWIDKNQRERVWRKGSHPLCQDFLTPPQKKYKQKVLPNFIKKNQNHPSSRIVKRKIRIVLSNIHRFSRPVLRSPLLWGLRLQPRGTIDSLFGSIQIRKKNVAISESFWILEATIKNRNFAWKTTLPWQQIMMLGLSYHWPKRKLMAWGCAKSLFQVNVPSTNTNDVDPLNILNLELFATC